MENDEKIKAALELEDQSSELASKKFLVGFDGVIDEIIHVVNTRKSKTEFTRFETIAELGKRISAAAGKSTNLELFPTHEKIGGNGPLMSLAVAELGCHVTSIGLMGYPYIEPVFKKMEERCNIYSLGTPGHTDALEFADGKIMMGKIALLNEVNWDRICEVIGEKKFLNIILQKDLVAITNWTMLLNLPEIIDHIIDAVPQNSKQVFFFDLADPEKRLKSEIAAVLKQMQTLNKKANCILGVNLSEAEQISGVLGLKEPIKDGVSGLEKLAKAIQAKMGLHGIVVHSVGYAGASIDGESTAIEGPFCDNPKITTGAGDHFNGGFTSALMGGVSLKSALYAGVAVSGWYVRNGGPSPTIKNVVELLNNWATGKLDKTPSKEQVSA